MMEQKKFESLLILLVPQIVSLIVENFREDELYASQKFYESKVYAALEQEETKLWHYSALTLFHMYEEECQTGTFTYPEEI